MSYRDKTPAAAGTPPSHTKLGSHRVGTVPYLNALPLTYGLEKELTVAPPSHLAELLRQGELEAGLVSVTETLFEEGYDILDDIAIASDGPAKSVFLAYTPPLESITEVFCDPASYTSIYLLRVLLAERDLFPSFHPLPGYSPDPMPDNLLLIGNQAIDFLHRSHPHEILDLGGDWRTVTGLPFVFAVWALRRGTHDARLRGALQNAKRDGLTHLDAIIRSRAEYDRRFRTEYLTHHLSYDLGAAEKQGLQHFANLLTKHLGKPTHIPPFVR